MFLIKKCQLERIHERFGAYTDIIYRFIYS